MTVQTIYHNLSHNNNTNNINIHTYNNIDYHKLSIMHINIRSFNHNVESLIVFIDQLNNIHSYRQCK